MNEREGEQQPALSSWRRESKESPAWDLSDVSPKELGSVEALDKEAAMPLEHTQTTHPAREQGTADSAISETHVRP